jgi:lambda repressor-like predicted transcriptional regulator
MTDRITSSQCSEEPDIKELLRANGHSLTSSAKTMGITLNALRAIVNRVSMPRADRGIILEDLTKTPLRQIYPKYKAAVS